METGEGQVDRTREASFHLQAPNASLTRIWPYRHVQYDRVHAVGCRVKAQQWALTPWRQLSFLSWTEEAVSVHFKGRTGQGSHISDVYCKSRALLQKAWTYKGPGPT